MRVGVLMAILVLAAGDSAQAQTQCAPLEPPNLLCTARFPRATQRLAIGDAIYCDGVPVSTVQYDLYSRLGGVRVYLCSTNILCSDPGLDAKARTKFCP